MLALPLLLAVARAAPPAGLLPLVDRPGLPVAFSQAALSEGRDEAAATPICRPFAEDLVLCLTVPEGDGARLVTRTDLGAWGIEPPDAERLALAAVARGLGPDRPQEVAVQGDPRTYLLSAEGDGLDQAALFHPDLLAARFRGRPFAVALPARGVLLAVRTGDPELERIVAVGARRLWETAEEPITPVLYAWREGAWQPWAEARPDGAPGDRPGDGPTTPPSGAAP